MNCPICTTVSLVMTERQGIEIDYCPQCRGVWLDRGELDKIIDRSMAGTSGQRFEDDRREHSRDYKSSDHYREPHREGQYKKKKREGFLSDLFDFD